MADPKKVFAEMEAFLESKGWRTRGVGFWCWFDPKFPGALHTMQHAYDIERSKKTKKGKKNATD